MINKKSFLFNLRELESHLNSFECFLLIDAGLIRNHAIQHEVVKKKKQVHAHELHQRLGDLILDCQIERETGQSILTQLYKIQSSVVRLKRYLNSEMNTQKMYKVSKKETLKISRVITELKFIKIT